LAAVGCRFSAPGFRFFPGGIFPFAVAFRRLPLIVGEVLVYLDVNVNEKEREHEHQPKTVGRMEWQHGLSVHPDQ
jgi:hypothetical protein